MILITGGLGFIGSHTTRALLDLGESCVLAQRRAPDSAPVPLFAEEIGGRVVVERVDLTDLTALRELGKRHEITGVVHLAGGLLPVDDPIGGARGALNGLFNVLEAAQDWGVRRVAVASTIGVYDGGDPSPLREDLPLPLTAAHSISAIKKPYEVLTSFLAPATGLELPVLRIGAVWGPLGRVGSPFFGMPQLVHAAVHGQEPDFSAMRRTPHADDGIDLIYARDCGRAIALLQLAPQLHHRVYNVAAGRTTTYREMVDVIREQVPSAVIEVADGSDPGVLSPEIHLDVSRLREDTGFEPAYDTRRAVADYVAWLRAGNER